MKMVSELHAFRVTFTDLKVHHALRRCCSALLHGRKRGLRRQHGEDSLLCRSRGGQREAGPGAPLSTLLASSPLKHGMVNQVGAARKGKSTEELIAAGLPKLASMGELEEGCVSCHRPP